MVPMTGSPFRDPFSLFSRFAILAVLLMMPAAALAQDTMEPRPFRGYRGPYISPALEMMLRDHLARGGELSPAVIRRWRLDQPGPGESLDHMHAVPFATSGIAATIALLPDVLVNDRTTDTGLACGTGPLAQSETTIAAHGGNLLAGWNDTMGFVEPTEAVQGYGYSTDNGATWFDGGSVPPIPAGGRYRGDPIHAVNRKTGDFYIGGLYEGGPLGWGLAVSRGHFSGPNFVFDLNIQPWVGGSDFLDKLWMEADSLSGNLYLTVSNFVGGTTSQIEMKRSLDNGSTWSNAMMLSSIASTGLVQGSRPVVGPDGELYVVWYEEGIPKSKIVIRRSDDFGVNFGADQVVTEFFENNYSGGPGYRRYFGPILPGIAVDRSGGPHRGRVYVTWAESVNFWDAPMSLDSPVSEVENNDYFASATPFTAGDVLRGSMGGSTDLDFFRFGGLQGQTFVVSGDSASDGTSLDMRLICSQDTTDIGSFRSLAYTRGQLPSLVFTLPADGEYFLRLSPVPNSSFGNYRLLTAFDIPSADDRARDHRDIFLAYSDDGSSWSTPARLNDDDPWFDNIFPEATVDGAGDVHVFWHDWRGDPVCGAETLEYMVSSGDGGVTWGPNRRVSDEQTFWSWYSCGSANQGDYQGITSQGDSVYICWADPRLGDVDVYVDRPAFSSVVSCPAPAAGTSAADPVLSFTLTNDGNVESELEWTIEDDNGWLASAVPSTDGSAFLSAGNSQMVEATFQIPSDCSPTAIDTIRFISADPEIPGRRDTCLTTLTCSPTVDAPGWTASLSLAPARPNPSTGSVDLRFTLSRPGPVRLVVYNASGARVRTLVGGIRPAGPHSIVWNGRDDRGRQVPSEVYFIRLDAEGTALTRPVVLVR